MKVFMMSNTWRGRSNFGIFVFVIGLVLFLGLGKVVASDPTFEGVLAYLRK